MHRRSPTLGLLAALAPAVWLGCADADIAQATRPFVSSVLSFTPGDGAGFDGEDDRGYPEIVYGPPRGGGLRSGSMDVLSLGFGGEIVLAFEERAIVDGPGPDLIVFENAFVFGPGDKVYAEPGEVAVSDDGATWFTFPCDAAAYPYEGCAGRHPVLSNDDAATALDPPRAGGDAFDLADLGLDRAHLVRVRDVSKGGAEGVGKAGFDLDAAAIVHADER